MTQKGCQTFDSQKSDKLKFFVWYDDSKNWNRHLHSSKEMYNLFIFQYIRTVDEYSWKIIQWVFP